MDEFTKKERLEVILKRLTDMPVPQNHKEAFEMLGEVFNEVEDEMTDIPNVPENWQSDGRMYPPQEDNARDVPDRPDLVRYRNRGHHTFIRANGAIEIRDMTGTVVFSKSGFDEVGVELET